MIDMANLLLREGTSRAWELLYRSVRHLNARAMHENFSFSLLSTQFYQKLWSQAAENVGAEFQEWDFGYQRIRRDGVTTVVRKSNVMVDDQITCAILANKVLTNQLLRETRCPVVDSWVFSMRDLPGGAERLLEQHPGPLVVKPATGTGAGAGVTTGITDALALRKALRVAFRYGRQVFIQKQIEGQSYRLLFLRGQLIDAVRRDSPVLTGDGQHTLRELVRLENKRRLHQRPFTALHPLRMDQDCRNKLSLQEVSLRSRPGRGQTVQLKNVANENNAGQNHNVLNSVAPETVRMCSELVQGLRLELAGLDIQCIDISVPLGPNTGAILEINTSPGLHHHYLISDPSKVVPVAELVLSYLFAEKRGLTGFFRG